MSSSFSKTVALCGALVALAACDNKDSSGPKAPAQPDLAACTTGPIAVNGAAVTGSVNGSSCDFYNNFYDNGYANVRAASYAIALDSGKVYQIASSLGGGATGDPNTLLLGKTGSGSEVALAEASWKPNTMWFYAAQGGTYSLRVYSSNPNDTNYTYTMQAVSCPVVATVVPSDTSYVDNASTLGTSSCLQENDFFGDGSDSSYVNYYLVQFAAGQTRWIQMTSESFDPSWVMGGPGFDSMWDFEGDGGVSGQGNDDLESFTADTAGTYTLVVGSSSFGATGAYTLTFWNTEPGQHVVTPPSLARAFKHVQLDRAQMVHALQPARH